MLTEVGDRTSQLTGLERGDGQCFENQGLITNGETRIQQRDRFTALRKARQGDHYQGDRPLEHCAIKRLGACATLVPAVPSIR